MNNYKGGNGTVKERVFTPYKHAPLRSRFRILLVIKGVNKISSA